MTKKAVISASVYAEDTDEGNRQEQAYTVDGGVLSQADSDFIAHAREDIPALLAEVERLQTLLANSAS